MSFYCFNRNRRVLLWMLFLIPVYLSANSYAPAIDRIFDPADFKVISIESLNGKPCIAKIRDMAKRVELEYVVGDYVGGFLLKSIEKDRIVLMDSISKTEYHVPVEGAPLPRRQVASEIIQMISLAGELEKEGKIDRAIEQYRRLVQLDPKNAEHYFKLGQLYEKQKFYKDAMQNYLLATKYAPEHEQALFAVALLYRMARNDLKAIEYLRKVLVLNPDHQGAQKLFLEIKTEREEARRTKRKKQAETLEFKFRETPDTVEAKVQVSDRSSSR